MYYRYEAISTLLDGMADDPIVIPLCVSKLRVFLDDTDQNRAFQCDARVHGLVTKLLR